MYVVTLDNLKGIFGPFETKENAENWLAADKGAILEVIQGTVLEVIPVDHAGLIP